MAELARTAPPAPQDREQQIAAILARQLALFEQSEAALDLKAENPELRSGVCRAIRVCADVQLARPTKGHDIRIGLIKVRDAAKVAAKGLRTLERALDAIEPQYRKWLLSPEESMRLDLAVETLRPIRSQLAARAARLRIEPASLIEDAARFDEFSVIAARYANMRKQHVDKGGAPKMLAFEALVEELADAFAKATGKPAKVTWNHVEGRYKGKSLALVNEALIVAKVVTDHLGAPLLYPRSELALGKFVYERTRAGNRKRYRLSSSRKRASAGEGQGPPQCSEPLVGSRRFRAFDLT